MADEATKEAEKVHHEKTPTIRLVLWKRDGMILEVGSFAGNTPREAQNAALGIRLPEDADDPEVEILRKLQDAAEKGKVDLAAPPASGIKWVERGFERKLV
jgi:hypothetical protein